MKQLNELCECGEPLYESEGNSKYNVIQCLNWKCRLHHQPQGYRSKGSRKDWPSWKPYLVRRRPERYGRYWELRKKGLTSLQAQRYRDVTSMTVDQIVEMFKKEGK